MGLLDDEEFLKKKRKPNLLANVQQLQRPAEPYLRQQYPEVYGGLGGLLGMAPDEMAGSILDPNTARVRAGAQIGFPVGTAAQVLPALGQLAPAVKAGARALGPTAVGMGERYLQSKGLMPGVVEGESIGLLGGPIKPQAPVSELGFYSAAEQAALNLPRKSGTGESFLNDLMKGQDVKKDELSWMGLDDYLKGKPNVTRQEVQDFIASNRVDVQERQLGAAVAEDPIGIAQRKAVFDKYEPEIQALYKEIDQYETNTINARNLASKNETEAIAALNREGNPQPIPTTDDWNRYYAAKAEMERVNKIPLDSREYVRKLDKLVRARDAEANSAYVIPESTPTKHPNWQLPGGENYREILLTLPVDARATYNKIAKEEFSNAYADLTPSQQTQVQGMARGRAQQNYEGVYTSSHFNEPNILAHMRVNDRVDADGKKMLLIEEIQSDWHQAGREKGYIGNYAKGDVKPYTPERAKAEFSLPNNDLFWYFEVPGNTLQIPKSRFGTQDEAMNYVLTEKKVNPEGVPDAPFKDTWHQLALKRALKYAADNGYDRVGLTTGRQQVDRYTNEMRQNVDELQFFPIGNQNNILISAKKGGKQTFSGTVADGKFIDGPAQGKTVTEVLGKSMAKQIAEKKDGVIKGDDLTIGGEGMKAYYDEIYPAFLAKQGKKYNAKTGETRIKTSKNLQDEDFVSGQLRISEALGDYGERGYKTTDNRFFDTYADAVSHEKKISSKDLFDATIRYIDISPEMRGGVKKGQPLFTAAPIGGIGLGAGTQDNEMPDAVRQYMANPTLGLLQDDEDERKKLGGLLFR